MRIAIGGIHQEQNTFSPALTDLCAFEDRYLLRGGEITARLSGTANEIAGALEAADEENAECVPTLWAQAVTAGCIRQETYQQLRADLMERIRTALPFDGVYLCLHGATVAEDEPDVAGDLLSRVRTIAGDLPVVASLDLHANVTHRMLEAATALVGYHTCPHVDMFETGYRAFKLLCATASGRVRPVMGHYHLPLLHAPENGGTDQGPLEPLMQDVAALEAMPDVLHVGLYPVQPWMDVPELASTSLVVTDHQPHQAAEQSRRLARLTWQRHDEFVARLTPLEQAIARAVALDEGPVIFADAGDNPAGGGTGDSTAILQALLLAGTPCSALLTVVDPESVGRAILKGIGNEVTLDVGGKIDHLFSRPIRVTGKVRGIHDGQFIYKSPVYRGTKGYMGRTVVLDVGNISVVLCEKPVVHIDPVTYECVGLAPSTARIVQAKSMMGFMAAYAPIAREIIWVDTPGFTTSNFARLPFQKAPRPMFPLDEVPDELVFPPSDR